MRFGSALRAGLRRGGTPAFSLLLLAFASSVMPPTVELLAPEKVAVGDTVDIVLRVRNDERQPMQLELAGRPVAFDIVITDQDGREVWRRLGQGAVSRALLLLTLQPGEARDFSVRWDTADSGGRRVTPGRYTIEGILPVGGGALKTPPRVLIVE